MNDHWENQLKRYDALVAQCDRFERKGKSVPCTTANGHMFSTLNKDGELGIRFSKEVQKRYLEEFNTDLFRSYNSVMLGYILITDEMLADEALMIRLFNESYDYVMGKDPK